MHETKYRRPVSGTALNGPTADNIQIGPKRFTCELKLYSWLRTVKRRMTPTQCVPCTQQQRQELSQYRAVQADCMEYDHFYLLCKCKDSAKEKEPESFARLQNEWTSLHRLAASIYVYENRIAILFCCTYVLFCFVRNGDFVRDAVPALTLHFQPIRASHRIEMRL